MPLIYRVENAGKQVEKQILKLPRPMRNRVARAILDLEKNPRPPGCAKLVDGIYRIHVGNYRVIYKILDRERLVLIGKVAKKRSYIYDDVDRLF